MRTKVPHALFFFEPSVKVRYGRARNCDVGLRGPGLPLVFKKSDSRRRSFKIVAFSPLNSQRHKFYPRITQSNGCFNHPTEARNFSNRASTSHGYQSGKKKINLLSRVALEHRPKTSPIIHTRPYLLGNFQQSVGGSTRSEGGGQCPEESGWLPILAYLFPHCVVDYRAFRKSYRKSTKPLCISMPAMNWTLWMRPFFFIHEITMARHDRNFIAHHALDIFYLRRIAGSPATLFLVTWRMRFWFEFRDYRVIHRGFVETHFFGLSFGWVHGCFNCQIAWFKFFFSGVFIRAAANDGRRKMKKNFRRGRKHEFFKRKVLVEPTFRSFNNKNGSYFIFVLVFKQIYFIGNLFRMRQVS